ncbi:ZIP family metal transporter [Afifella pfennigii]|uniref:ZIP family metal transporter n=1 Tax=Afifella pfennigii TaxID=209897 RepID=UPI000A580EB8|nr:ZIP family metal transporter [Afifella pfennigii]
MLDDLSPLTLGLFGSLAAGLMTGVGAIPVLFGRVPGERARDTLLGFAAGVMLAATFFSLIIPALDVSAELYGDGVVPAAIAVAGILLGMGTIAALDHTMPHEHFQTGPEGPIRPSLRRIWLFVIAITLHNFPEGLAVGVGFGTGDVATGLPLAIGIGLQNAPEGLAVAVALTGEGYPRGRAVRIATYTGLVEPVGGLIGAAVVSISEPMLPWGLVFAAGAMIYVISHEIIPETHRRGFQNEATAGLGIGLVTMLFLDVWLG